MTRRGGTIGLPVDRVDGRLKVTGRATYAADTRLDGLVHAVIVTSAVARGQIVQLEVGAASRARGVLAILTHENAPRLPRAGTTLHRPDRTIQLLQSDEITYADQPIALVVADTLERAQHAAALVRARYRTEAAMADLVSNLGDAYTPDSAGPHGPAVTSRGDVDAGLGFASTVAAGTYTTPVQNHHPMEPHATVAAWDGDRLTVYDATQWVNGVQHRLAELFLLPDDHVRVVDPFVGGAFGCKGTTWSHTALAAMAARVVGRPVKLVLTRQQMCSLVGHRPRTVQTVAVGCDVNGRLAALRHDTVSETATFDEFVEASAVQSRMLYACPNVATSHRLVKIDIPAATYQRAPGTATGTFALEVAMDELAFASGLDPLELRLASYALDDPQDHRPWSSKALRECYRVAAEKFGWQRRPAKPRSLRRGHELVGWGMATATYPANQMAASARATVRADGRAVVQSATHDLGTGTYTVMTQIAADALGLPIDAVRFELGDTLLPDAPLSAGSMTAASVGCAVDAACRALIRGAAERAVGDRSSPLYGLAIDQLAARDGALVARTDSTRREPLAAIAARQPGGALVAERHNEAAPERQRYATHAFGADFAEVRVDEELGTIRVSRLVAAFAIGTVLNPKTATSQLQGGLVWAIGMALHEQTVRDRRTARVVTRDLEGYHVPVCADVPELDVLLVHEVDPHVNPLGVKGAGEIGITGATAAIANAVFHATGRRIRELPITIEKLL